MINSHKINEPLDHPPIKKEGTFKSSELTSKKLKVIIPKRPKNPIIEKKKIVRVKGLSLEHNRHVVTFPIAKKNPPMIGRKLKNIVVLGVSKIDGEILIFCQVPERII